MNEEDYEELAQTFYKDLQGLVHGFAEKNEAVPPDIQYSIIVYAFISAMFTLVDIPGGNPKDLLCSLIEKMPLEEQPTDKGQAAVSFD
jgi:hypothetical protein